MSRHGGHPPWPPPRPRLTGNSRWLLLSVIARLVAPSAAQRGGAAPLAPRGSTIPSDLARKCPRVRFGDCPVFQKWLSPRRMARMWHAPEWSYCPVYASGLGCVSAAQRSRSSSQAAHPPVSCRQSSTNCSVAASACRLSAGIARTLAWGSPTPTKLATRCTLSGSLIVTSS